MTAPITPVGSFSAPAASLRRMLSVCPTWQAETRTIGDPARALDRVFLSNVIGLEPRPYAIVSPGADHDYTLVSGGVRNFLRPSGSLFLYIARDTETPYGDDLIEAEFAAANLFGSLVDEIAELSAADYEAADESHLAIVAISLLVFGETPEDKWQSLGRFWFAGYSVKWGDGG